MHRIHRDGSIENAAAWCHAIVDCAGGEGRDRINIGSADSLLSPSS
ncbi:hypothetical protein ACE10Z_06185 [Bradyrhizobium sp. Pha-3]